MNTNPNIPTDITPEEKQAGFRLVETRLPLPDSGPSGGHILTTVAILDLDPSFRLIKMLDINLPSRTRGVCYQLQSFGVDTHPMNKGLDKPQWRQLWDGPSSTMDLALKRYKTDKGGKFWKSVLPPDEPAENPLTPPPPVHPKPKAPSPLAFEPPPVNADLETTAEPRNPNISEDERACNITPASPLQPAAEVATVPPVLDGVNKNNSVENDRVGECPYDLEKCFRIKIDDSQIHSEDTTFMLADIKIVELVDDHDPFWYKFACFAAVAGVFTCAAGYIIHLERLFWIIAAPSLYLIYHCYMESFSVFVFTSVGRKRIIRFRFFDIFFNGFECKSYARAYKRASAVKNAISDAIARKHTPKNLDGAQTALNESTQPLQP